jgi:hypothetical protein
LGTQNIGGRQTKEKQSRETGNIGYTRHRRKTNKRKKHTAQKTKKMNPGAREWQAVPASYKTPIMFLT